VVGPFLSLFFGLTIHLFVKEPLLIDSSDCRLGKSSWGREERRGEERRGEERRGKEREVKRGN
jgi:hypothetical protein